MKKFLLIVALAASAHLTSTGQTLPNDAVYVIDSIPVDDEASLEFEVSKDDLADLTVVTDPGKLAALGYKSSSVIYLFTKEYRSRPDSIRKIITTKRLERTGGVWRLYGVPYNGPFIDYFYNGKKQGEGFLLNGLLTGRRVMFYKNGKISSERNYKAGLANGAGIEYYEDGSIKQKGEFLSGKEEGTWFAYFPNGQIKLRTDYVNGKVEGTATTYYSSGRILESVIIKNSKVTGDPAVEKIKKIMGKSFRSFEEHDFDSSINYCSQVLNIDSNYAEAYFSRGTSKLYNFQFDEAIADFDKALQIEPYMEKSLSNRAFARIRKYQFANSRKLSSNKNVEILASSDKVSIPADDQEKICDDLKRAVFLGDKSKMTLDAINEFCLR